VKRGLDQNAHAIIYTGEKPPKKLPEEKRLTKDPIQVVPVGGHTLDALSRVDLAKGYPVEHTVEVLEVGSVSGGHLEKLVAYWKSEQERGFPAKEVYSPTEGSEKKSKTWLQKISKRPASSPLASVNENPSPS